MTTIDLGQGARRSVAEAFAEYLHQKARHERGYGKQEKLSNEQLIDEQYRGIRPAPAIRRVRSHRETPPVDLLEAEKLARISLTENFAMSRRPA